MAGKQKGKGDDRYLWPEMLRVIRELRPRWVLGENVPGILRIAADDVCKDLEREGYDVGIFDFEAAAVGAPHRRERIFFVANDGGGGRDKQDNASKLSRGANVKRTDEIIPDTESKQNRRLYQPGLQSDIRTSGDVADTDNEGLERRHEYCSAVSRENERFQSWTESGGTKFISRSDEIAADSEVNRLQRDWAGREQIADSRCEKGQFERLCNGLHASDTDSERLQISRYESPIKTPFAEIGIKFSDWWATEPNVGRVAHGIPNRVDRLKCLGNAVVPAQIYPILKAIADIENSAELCTGVLEGE